MTNFEEIKAGLEKLVEEFKNQHGENFVFICRELAGNGDVKAQMLLGGFYALAVGLPQHYVYAHKWFNIVASKGNDYGVVLRDDIASNMTPEQIVRAQDLAVEWVEEHPNI